MIQGLLGLLKLIGVLGCSTNTFASEYVKVHGAAGNATPVSQVVDPELPVFSTNIATFDFKGIRTSVGKDIHFAQLKYNGDHTATFKEGVGMHGCRVHPYFTGIYASILAEDKDGNTLFTKEFKGTDYVQVKEENFSLPEGATLTFFHAEGTSGRYETSNDTEFKQEPGYTYHYMVKNNKLVQIPDKRRICAAYQPNKCLDANDAYENLFFWYKQNEANRIFQFIGTNHANVYKIKMYTGKWLAASPKLGSTLNKVTQESQASLWLLKNIGNNYYNIAYAGTTNNYQDPTKQLNELVVTIQENDSDLTPDYGKAPFLWFDSGDSVYNLKVQQFQFDPM
ncbi:putative mucin/carbohydrate-binding domain-containing protein (plasmid) [Enterococcus faecium]|uniref:putative mucin/carbohydrate-binding domain-containing protein n=1 Tax=Enterococcus faecium TaxID=1352 RepID=UPI0038D4DFA0